MKTINKVLFILLTFICIALSASAGISDQEEMIKRRAAEKVAQMNDYISFMANKKKSQEVRRNYKKYALNLFMGKGFEYEENGVPKTGVMMEVTSKYRKTVSHPLIRNYFQNIIDMQYTDVKITSTEIANIKVSDLHQIDSNLFVCTCQYNQAFIGYKDGRPAYKDITTKRIKCYVKAEDTEDGTEYVIMLGDITAERTREM